MPELITELEREISGAPSFEAGGTGADSRPGRFADLLQGDERPARVDLRRQIARLELELGELFTSAFPRAGIGYDVAPAGGPRLLGIGELEQVRDRLLDRIADVRGILSDRP